MRPSRERFLDRFTTVRAILTGVLRGSHNCRNPIYLAEILNPSSKFTPCCITDRLSQVPILDHVANPQVFQCHEVVRLHSAPCSFYCKVSTLALKFQMCFSQALDCFTSILGIFDFFRGSALRSFEALLSPPQMSRIFNSIAIRIGVEVVQSHINPNRSLHLTCITCCQGSHIRAGLSRHVVPY
jgi:hypothetical protein